jgi:chromosome segregation ATPase
MATIQQELKPQPRETPDDDLDEMYEEEPRRRAWCAIASVVLALALVFVGYQWNQAATRAEALGAQVNGMRAEAETQRLRAEDAQRQVDLVQKRLAAISAEKDSLAERLVTLEKAAAPRPVAAKAEKAEKPKAATKVTTAAPARPKATPVASRPTPAKRTPTP